MKSSDYRITAFQIKLAAELLDILGSADTAIDSSFVIGASENYLHIKLRELTFWIYEDGCQLDCDEAEIRFEKEDYENLAGLAEDFLAKASSLAQSH